MARGDGETTTPALCDASVWCIDTQADISMTPQRSFFDTYASYTAKIKGVGSATALGKGAIKRTVSTKDSNSSEITFNAVHCTSLDRNILSERALRLGGHEFDTKARELHLADGRVIPTIIIDGYHCVSMGESDVARPPPLTGSLMRWHERCVHSDYRTVKTAAGMVDGMLLTSSKIPSTLCEPCVQAKMRRLPFPESGRRATTRGELVLHDLQGPLPCISTREPAQGDLR